MLLFWAVLLAVTLVCDSHEPANTLLHTCLDGVNHKHRPGQEDKLHNQCVPWRNYACCTAEVTRKMHQDRGLYNFNWSHCDIPLSKACEKHFMQDLCFYECSPNLGPWLAPVTMKIRNEKAFHVPLCKSVCEDWFKDCKYDHTCVKNWAKHGQSFDWKSGTNKCLAGNSCKLIKDMYSSASEFCEMVWDYSWKVVEDSEPCFQIWFDPSKGNPNDAVALAKVQEMQSSGAEFRQWTTLHIAFVVGFFIMYI